MQEPIPQDPENPPFLHSWRNVYAATLLILALYVTAMYLFRLAFS